MYTLCMRIAPVIKLADAERDVLKSIAKSRRQPVRLVQRANIVLLAERGLENIDIAQRLHVSLPLVGRWRRHYAEKGFAGIEKMERGRPESRKRTLRWFKPLSQKRHKKRRPGKRIGAKIRIESL